VIQQNGFKYRAGQYAFINIPALSALEWHPFTISSAPGENIISFHIKNMGKSSWTSRLSELCKIVDGGVGGEIKPPTSSLPVVNIDGPYGSPPTFHTSSVVLVGGGIGITPLISLFKDQYFYHQTSKLASNTVKHITLLWIVRDIATIKIFENMLLKILTNTTTAQTFDVILYTTKVPDDVEGKHVTLTPKLGRPMLREELSSIVNKHKKHTSVMVCGPRHLVYETRNVCYTLGVKELHEETFEL